MSVSQDNLVIPAGGVSLEGDVVVPDSARGVVLFVHGSGSSRFSSRNRYVATQLQERGLATVLADLLTHEEEEFDSRTGVVRFDIGLLSTRVIDMVDWIAAHEPVARLPIGLFGASTGAAAALVTGAERPTLVRTLVSRGGRPDLAGEFLRRVNQPTLLIVGERDQVVIDLNRKAMAQMPGETRLEIVPRATHLFEEPGTLERVAELAGEWFVQQLGTAHDPGAAGQRG
jgi:pimeloyl-ACP methyl ester carboxylesterase